MKGSSACYESVGLPVSYFEPVSLSPVVCSKGKIITTQYILYTVGPLIIESLWAKNGVSTGALEALDNPLVVQKKKWKTWVPVDNS